MEGQSWGAKHIKIKTFFKNRDDAIFLIIVEVPSPLLSRLYDFSNFEPYFAPGTMARRELTSHRHPGMPRAAVAQLGGPTLH